MTLRMSERCLYFRKAAKDDEIAGYVAEVKNVEQFLLSLGYLQFNESFRAESGILPVTSTITGMSRIGSCTTVQATRVARIMCAVNFGEDFAAIVCGVGLLYRP
jgi:hypothetical protein